MRRPRPSTDTEPVRSERFGLIGWLQETRVELPLKGVECRFHVCGDVATVEIDQIFYQNNPQPMHCLYTFPLPGDAAVFRCEMHVNGRVVLGKVEPLEAARDFVRARKSEGHRTALAQMERANLFSLELGNLASGDVVVMRFGYVQSITRWQKEGTLQIPFCPGVRYIPGEPLLRSNSGRGTADDTDQVPDASRISPPRIDALHPDAAYLAVEGRIEHPGVPLASVVSPSHALRVRDAAGCSEIQMAERSAVPDCDLILRWTEESSMALESVAWVNRQKDETYALVRLTAPDVVNSAVQHAQDIYFLVDRSGSMAGMKWTKACEAFRAFLRALGAQDRVWATFFHDKFQDLAEKPMPPAALLADRAVRTIEELGTGGGTQLWPALQHVLSIVEKHSRNRQAAILLITDGQVGNEQEILSSLQRNADVRVHTFGIDTAVNDAFLKRLARTHRGTCCLCSPNDDIVATVGRLGGRLRRPVLTELRIRGDWVLAESSLPDLHEAETVNVAMRAGAGVQSVEWEGRLPDGTWTVFPSPMTERTGDALAVLWAHRQIELLTEAGQVTEAIAVAQKYNVLGPGTAFVAWDPAEKMVVGGAPLELYQPSQEVRRMGFMDTVAMRSAAPPAGMMSSFFDAAVPPSPAPLKLGKTLLGFRRRRPKGDDAASVDADANGPLIREVRSVWRDDLELALSFLESGVRQSLLDWLEQWFLSAPAQQSKRNDQLEALVQRLQSAKRDGSIAMIAELRRWVAQVWSAEPEFQIPVTVILDGIERSNPS